MRQLVLGPRLLAAADCVNSYVVSSYLWVQLLRSVSAHQQVEAQSIFAIIV